MSNYFERYTNLSPDKKALFALRLDAMSPVEPALTEDTGSKHLVAYVVWKKGHTPQPVELRKYLKGRLPEYMIPSAYADLTSPPLTPNGKIDRKALPAPDGARPELEQAFVAPGTPVEEELARIWSEVLGLNQIGIHDNFFDLGGHSLIATQVMSRLRAAFHVELPLRSIFETPTIAGLSLTLVQAQATMMDSVAVSKMLEELEESGVALG